MMNSFFVVIHLVESATMCYDCGNITIRCIPRKLISGLHHCIPARFTIIYFTLAAFKLASPGCEITQIFLSYSEKCVRLENKTMSQGFI